MSPLSTYNLEQKNIAIPDKVDLNYKEDILPPSLQT
jgi:hypothetical protein